jgi:hypothetical protein
VNGAGMQASPVEHREGFFSWQQNMAHGGGIYEVWSPSGGATGQLTISAPAAAFGGSGPSSACGDATGGATIAGWHKDRICWQPIGTTAVTPPEGGADTFNASAEVTIAGPETFVSLQVTGAYTLYTVGFDNDPPVITPTLATGAIVAELPAVVAHVTDALAGVDALSGVSVSLNGTPLPLTFDPATGAVHLPAGSRRPPGTSAGPATLRVRAVDGFCNGAETEVAVTFRDTRAIYLPFSLRPTGR